MGHLRRSGFAVLTICVIGFSWANPVLAQAYRMADSLPTVVLMAGQTRTVDLPCDRTNIHMPCSVIFAADQHPGGMAARPDTTPDAWFSCYEQWNNAFGMMLYKNQINVDYWGNGSWFGNSSMFAVLQENSSGTNSQLGWVAQPQSPTLAPVGTNTWSTWFDAAQTTTFYWTFIGNPFGATTTTEHFKLVHGYPVGNAMPTVQCYYQ